MKRLLGLSLCLGLLIGAGCSEQPYSAARVDLLEQQGHFKEAAAVLTAALENKSLSPEERKNLEFERDRLDRIKKDFSLTKQTLFSFLRGSVKDLTAPEYEQWVKEGRFDSREIDGQLYFEHSSVDNLFMRYQELDPRRVPFDNHAAKQKAFLDSCRAIKAAALAEKKPYVLPKRFEVTMNVSANAGAAPAGEIVRAWLPIPREYPFQKDFELVSASPTVKHLDDPTSPIRSIYFEEAARKDEPTDFTITYRYTINGVCFDPKPEEVRPCDANNAALREFTQEAPHVVFTPEMRALSQKIVGNETNPCVIAKKCYDWISDNIKYSYAIEYSTIRNISDYCRSRGYGDCGQEAMLFITLCRLNGIPARWETGWHTFPQLQSIHDWSEIYLAPYGWMPVDPYMGLYAMRYCKTLTPEERREVRDFYFGGLDQYRIIANSDHNQKLTPPKQSMRSDNVDFQRGELEWGEHNIYFDQFSYTLKREEVKASAEETKPKRVE